MYNNIIMLRKNHIVIFSVGGDRYCTPHDYDDGLHVTYVRVTQAKIARAKTRLFFRPADDTNVKIS